MTLTATIDRLAFGGNGVCRINGKVCFVPMSCPGDTVTLKVTSAKKSYCLADIVTIQNPSPLREPPVCPVYGECGGCTWQHVNYQTQLEQKRAILCDALWRSARVPATAVAQPLAAPDRFGYRSRMQFKVSRAGGKLRIGFFRPNSHTVVDVGEQCPVAAPSINRVLSLFRQILTTSPVKPDVVQLEINSADNGVMVLLHLDGKLTSGFRNYFVDVQQHAAECIGLYAVSKESGLAEQLWGDDKLFYTQQVKGKVFRLGYSPGGFAQVNLEQNRAMLDVIISTAGLLPTDELLDLYCGNGNLSIPLSEMIASVTGVEASEGSIAAANDNKFCNGIGNATFLCGETGPVVRSFVKEQKRFDVVLLDPPRAGAGDATRDIAGLNPRSVVYVSCDPATLARDCGILAEYGYHVVTSVPIDMFPHTYHIESVTLLQRGR